jgi:hypothetical protein
MTTAAASTRAAGHAGTHPQTRGGACDADQALR